MNRLKQFVKTDRWVTPYFGKYREQMRLALVLGLTTLLCSILLMFTSGYLIERTAEVEGIFFVLTPVAFTQVFGLGKPFAHYFERLYSHDWVFRMTSSLRLRLYAVLEKHAMSIKGARQTGDIFGMISEDIGHLQNLYLRTIFPTVIAWTLYGLAVVALGLFTWWFGLLMLVALGVTVFVLPYVSVKVNRARLARLKSAKDSLYTELTDNILGVTDWIFSARGGEYLSHYENQQNSVRREQARINRYQRINDLLATICFGTLAVCMLIWASTRFGSGTPGGSSDWIAAFVLGFFPLVEAFTPLPMAITQAQTYRDSITRLNDMPSDVDFTDEEAYLDGQTACAHDQARPAGFDLEIEHITYRYDDDSADVISDLSLTIRQKEKIAILGRSGSGKSTLAKLIRGDAHPAGGTVSIGGVSASSIVEDMPHYIGIVAQQAYLFNRTLRENLTIGAPDASDDEIWDALRAVKLTKMAGALPAGLDTMVDEAGMRFSGGERHRIALARVLLAHTPIVVLDEPTVGLDPAIEHDLIETLFETMKDKTLIMITHHLQDIERFDRVVFIEDGRIDLDGTPEQLAQTSERFKRLLSFDRGTNLSL